MAEAKKTFKKLEEIKESKEITRETIEEYCARTAEDTLWYLKITHSKVEHPIYPKVEVTKLRAKKDANGDTLKDANGNAIMEEYTALVANKKAPALRTELKDITFPEIKSKFVEMYAPQLKSKTPKAKISPIKQGALELAKKHGIDIDAILGK